MIIISGKNYGTVKNNETVSKPGWKFRKLIREAKSKVDFYNADCFLTLPGSDKDTAAYAGKAGYSSDTKNTYTICVSGYTMDQHIKYQAWVVRHELRHCDASKGRIVDLAGMPFRGHDVELLDMGFDKPRSIGFFMEDFQEIKCCDKLMFYFSNIKGLEEYLS